MPEDRVQVPSSAVTEDDDIFRPTAALLCGLNLLPPKGDLKKAGKFSSAFGGPPDTVALIEAGATAASKWWAAGLGGGVIAAWVAVREWWSSATAANQQVSLWAAAIVTAAAVAGIAYLLGSDVRGRAAVATETVRARAHVAEAFVGAAERAHDRVANGGAPGSAEDRRVLVVALPLFAVRNVSRAGNCAKGWRAVALATDANNQNRYLIAKGATHEWVREDQVQLS